MSSSTPNKRSALDWDLDWRRFGFNRSVAVAIRALRYLADNDRPTGGSDRFNAEHLFQVAGELEVTQSELLEGSRLALEAQEAELLAWRLRYPAQVFQAGEGIVPKSSAE